ncbi:MAG: transcriptional regulator, partial [Pseudomonadota bacterium]
LRVIQHVELHEGRSEDLPDEARKLALLAMEREPMNSMVVAAVANTRLVLDNDVNVCMELARRSVRLNPANPLAWNSLATAKLYAGDIGEAHALAVRAQKISSGSPFGHWWDFGRCLTAALTGRKAEALQLAEAAHALSPEFRPPLRYLTALYAADERFDEAQRTAERLKKLEPDFSFERMAKDETYPISPLRWGGLLDSGKVIALSG